MRLRPGISAALAVLVTAAPCHTLRAQTAWGGELWRVEAAAAAVESVEGREALRLHNGTAWLEGPALRDGTVRVDVRMSGELGFHGIAFRAAGDADYEHVYVRPFVSGNPDASQYTPVFHGVTGWQLFSGPRFGGAVHVATDRWVRLELRVEDDRAELHVDGQRLVFPELLRDPAPGAIGLTSSGAPAHFSDVVVTADPPVLDGGQGAEAEPPPPGTVRRWRVSTPFAEDRLDPVADLSRDLVDGLAWDTLRSGPRGIANLASRRARTPEANTVFAAVTLRSARDVRVPVRFGFSDRVTVYLDGRPLYRGADRWQSRDYRFLGTVGLHDEVVLPLTPGEHELWLAVSEDFGGWGVVLQIPEGSGVSVVGGGE